MDDMAAERFALLYTNSHQLKSKQIQGTYLFGGGSMGGVENLSGPGSLVNQMVNPTNRRKKQSKNSLIIDIIVRLNKFKVTDNSISK